MPAIAALSVNDGQTTPVAHTFNPQSTTGAKAVWADRSPTIPAGYRLISHEISEPNGNRTVYKFTMGFTDPKVVTVDGSDTVARYNSAKVELNIHPQSTLQDRKDILAYVANTLGLASMKTSVENLEPFY